MSRCRQDQPTSHQLYLSIRDPVKQQQCVSDACAPPTSCHKATDHFFPGQRTKFNSSSSQTTSALPSYTRPCELSETVFSSTPLETQS